MPLKRQLINSITKRSTVPFKSVDQRFYFRQQDTQKHAPRQTQNSKSSLTAQVNWTKNSSGAILQLNCSYMKSFLF